MADGRRSVTELCEIAAERGLMVDMHCDETDDPLSRHIEQLAYETQRLGLQGRVAGSHLTSMHSMDNYYVSKLLPLIAEAGVSAIPNPLINIMLQGRHDTYPKRRGMTRVPEMLKRTASASASARIACSTPGIRWAPPTCSTSPSWACMSRRCPSPADMRALLRHGDHGQRRDHGPRPSRPGGRQARQPRRARRRQPDRGDPAARRAALRHRQGQGRGERRRQDTALSLPGRPAR